MLGLLSLIFCAHASADAPRVLSLREALDLSQDYNPELKAATQREVQARAGIKIARSDYLPHISVEALDSMGFPGSTSSLGIQGLMGSPFRAGLGAGLVLTQNIFDFGRSYFDIQVAKAGLQQLRQETELNRYRTDSTVIQLYFSCVLNRVQRQSWQMLAKDTALVAHEVEKFVRTGQRSIVDRYLAQAQMEDAATHVEDYLAREKVSEARVRWVTGLQGVFSCPDFETLAQEPGLKAATGENPFIAAARFRLEAAEAGLGKSRAEGLPWLVGIASFGYLENARLVNSEDYSLGIGLRFPLFTGFRVQGEIQRSAARVEESGNLVESSKLVLGEQNGQYEELISSALVRVEHLTQEREIAQKALDVSKQRYFGLQGSLVDLRDAIKNQERVDESLNFARVEAAQFKALQAVLNGAR